MNPQDETQAPWVTMSLCVGGLCAALLALVIVILAGYKGPRL